MRPDPASILIVDDEPAICDLIRDELSDCGYVCWTATDPRQARDLLGIRRFDLLITDISMPQVSGLDLLAHVKRRAPDSKVILITGRSSRDYLVQALMLGADDYVEKPFSTEDLVAVVSEALDSDGCIPKLPIRAAEAIETSLQAKQASFDGVRALARAVEAKDPYTFHHSEHVAYYAVHLAREVGLEEPLVERVRVASLLHDVGKIGVPDHILTKSERLTDEEFEFIRRHPALGADIVANITLFDREARLIRHHHEDWDGRGYPDALAGEQIPPGSRIMQAADCMDAMLMERTYKKGYPVGEVLDELVRCSGTQFAPEISEAAVRWCRRNSSKLVLPHRPLEAVA